VISLIAAAWSVQACAGSRDEYRPYLPLPQHSHNPAVAAAVTGVAVAAYAVGGGCKIADCPADTVCNPGTERCERIECSDSIPNGDCPPSTQCSASSGTCVPF